ncbi:DNA repair protein RecO [Alkalicoccus urumqiensis]|uniref:DNA repair protein RecO n=1 Tax=Alkalicoccus urumqiensis TaxID=1548213 RepID=A0A2P6MFT8_ALKUR|nr:DNA repair protein RecO [Alkalicoccus urumqiensis]PRO65110.1 DNA repair protein RecO [Alkalicoccus urumqiensis]
MLHRLDGIVLRTTDYGESNKVVTILTPEEGKTALMARGAKKPKSPFASACQPLIHAVFVYYQGRGMGSLNQADIVTSFRKLRTDLLLTAYATYTLELIDRLTEDRTPSRPLYDLAYFVLLAMEEGADPEVLVRLAETKMLAFTGSAPLLHACRECGSAEGPFRFSMQHGGVLCPDHQYDAERLMPVGPKTIKLLRLFQQMPPDRIGEIRVKPETKKEMKLLLETYYDTYVGVRLKARRFLEQMEAMENPED